MLQNKLGRLLPFGLLMLAVGLILRNFTHAHYADFGAGFLIGMSLVFMIAGFVSGRRTSTH